MVTRGNLFLNESSLSKAYSALAPFVVANSRESSIAAILRLRVRRTQTYVSALNRFLLESSIYKKVSRVFLLVILLTSCGSHLVINPEDCDTKGVWGRSQIIKSIDKELFQFEFKESIWTPFGFAYSTDIYLKQFIEDRNLLCSRLDSLEVEMKTQWYEGILRFIPFMSRKTVIVRGLYAPESFTDED